MLRASLGKVVHTVKRAGTYAAKVPPQELHKIAVHVRAVVPPAFGAGGGQTRWVERGWGVNILEDAKHCFVLLVLYIRKYFVELTELILLNIKAVLKCRLFLTVYCHQIELVVEGEYRK